MNASGAAAPRTWALKAALVLLAGGVCAFLYVLFAASSKPDPAAYAGLAQGAMRQLIVLDAPPPRPTRSLIDGQGQAATLDRFDGEVVLVNYWATWCAPCVEEMPTLAMLHRRFEGRGFRVVPISVDFAYDTEKSKAELARLSDGALDFLIEPTRAILFDAQVNGMPTSVLYDRNGREIARLTGNTDWSGPEAAAVIERALAE